MGFFRKSKPAGSDDLDGAIDSARSIIFTNGSMDYRNSKATEVGLNFLDVLGKIYALGGCEGIYMLMRETKPDKRYFYDKLNWFHREYCSGQLGR